MTLRDQARGKKEQARDQATRGSPEKPSPAGSSTIGAVTPTTTKDTSMYKVITETINVSQHQFNRGRRSIAIMNEDGDDPIYAEVSVPAEDRWGGQTGINITINARPSVPVNIIPDYSTTLAWPGAYSPNQEAKKELMTARLHEVCKQAEDWVKTFVYTKDAGKR